MSVLYLLIPLALAMAAGALGAFLWSVRKGQLDDMDSPPMRAVFDDDWGTDRQKGSPEQSTSVSGKTTANHLDDDA